MNFCYLNGKFLPTSEAFIGVDDLSYQFGLGLFETFVSQNKKIPLLDRHLGRLEWSSTFLNIDYPSLDYAQICNELLEKNKFSDARFKIILSAKKNTVENPDSELHPANLLILCESFDKKNLKKNYKIKTIKNLINDTPPLSSLKTTNYLVKHFAKQQALEAGCDDALLLNSKGRVSECTSGNLFWIDKDAKLHTTSSDQGSLVGITQAELKKLLKEKKLAFVEASITAEDLSHAREIFLTNSVVGIMPVVEVDQRQISGGEAGPITMMIQDLWEKHLNEK